MNLHALISGSDVRGVALGEKANLREPEARRLGQAFVAFLRGRGISSPRVNIGRDPRLSGEALEQACAQGMAQAGAKVCIFGLCTTPAMYLSLVHEGADASIMVTASHLPMERNGLKFFLPDGGITSATLRAILDIADSGEDLTSPGGEISSHRYLDTYMDILASDIRGMLHTDADKPLSGLHIAVDAGNGAGGFYATLLERLGADTAGSQFLEPDGSFPNHIPNPENQAAMDAISRAVTAAHADLGVIFDTDCDRAAIVDNTGREINRNRLIALISAILLRDQPGATIVTDSVTSAGLSEFIAAHGGVHHRFKRGYRNVIDESRRLCSEGVCSPLAIETSGHAALQEHYFLDDGMYLVTKLICEAVKMKAQGQELSSLIADLREPVESAELRFTIQAEDFRAAGNEVIAHLTAYAQAHGWNLAKNSYEGVRISFDLQGRRDSGWFLLRLSLHDPVLPLNLESDVPGGIREMALLLQEALREEACISTSALNSLM